MTANGPYTKENIWKNLSTDDKVLYWALLNMLRMQTPDEQVELRTTHVNRRGFNSADAAFGTSLAQQYQVRKSLSQKQKDMARKMLRKYCGQLADIANENWARKQREMGLQKNPMFSGRSSSQSLYESFHGNPSKGTRKVKVNVPEPGDTLVKIGRLTELRYRPEEPSQHTGTEFYHKMGDTGRMVLKNKPILATGPDGKGLFIIDDKASPKFTDRGIIG